MRKIILLRILILFILVSVLGMLGCAEYVKVKQYDADLMALRRNVSNADRKSEELAAKVSTLTQSVN